MDVDLNSLLIIIGDKVVEIHFLRDQVKQLQDKIIKLEEKLKPDDNQSRPV